MGGREREELISSVKSSSTVEICTLFSLLTNIKTFNFNYDFFKLVKFQFILFIYLWRISAEKMHGRKYWDQQYARHNSILYRV